MKTRNPFKLVFAFTFIFVFVLVACQKESAFIKNPDLKNPPVKIFLTDHATPVFDSVFIDIRKLEVKLEDDTLPNDGWVNLAINPGVYNILRFRNGLDTLFATGTLPNSRIRRVRMTLGTQNSVMANNQSYPLKIKDNNSEVVINLSDANFDISNGQVLLWLDFDAGNSIKVDNSGPGNNNGYELKAHIKAFGKNNTGRIEGKVLPLAANSIVKAVMGADTATAIPNNGSGEFKIVGLNAGIYTVIIDGQNGYVDTTINNVRVVNREDTKISTITLHQ